MITVETYMLKNEMVVYEDRKQYLVRPSGWDKKGFRGALKRYFTTEYILFDSKNNVVGVVTYDGKKDQISIKKDGKVYKTKHHLLGPDEFRYNNKIYQIYEKLSGKIVVTYKREIVATADVRRGPLPSEIPKRSKHIQKVVAEGKWGIASLMFTRYSEELKEILKFIGVGYSIKLMLVLMII